ncbi:hypothetical protein BC936DRAFT_149829 [Jimgerdemannia flammicorona]|uniref:dihydrolipoyllysine-residue succinyltransferase n=1 Tax=Jimgerdemannia flammicorona TaxID=994334 RepID=A0A433DN03_9FUNG|nr:hypothetical protein BC936DRAFT_149829 [Jimgerdemannia flammicorona]
MIMSSSRATPLLLSSARALRASAARSSTISLWHVAQTRAIHVQVPAAAPLLIGSERLRKFCVIPRQQVRFYADKVVQVPHMADSISEGTLKQWLKKVGQFVKQDEEVATIETDKVDISVNSPASGTIVEVFANEEDTVAVGADLFKLELGDAPSGGATETPKETPKEAPKETPEEAPKETPEETPEETPKEAPKEALKEASKKEGVTPAPAVPAPKAPAAPAPATSAPASKPAPGPEASARSTPSAYGSREERRVKMNRMRSTIANRLKASQNTAASLTTFNEIDMSSLIDLRNTYKDTVLKTHGIKLGFMSAFVKASVAALHELPSVNASIDGEEIVYHDFIDLSVAVATPKGLVTPVLRNAEKMSFIEVEKQIAELGAKARDNKITIEDMTGGTFTISNGGVYGSLYGTPIINLPQTAILGMHAIKERPIAVNGKVEIRPMMYVALTYDHRLIDGREAVTFLVKIKNIIEDPRRLLLDI